MVTDASVEYFYSPEVPGMPIALVIDGEVLYTVPVWSTFGELLLSATEFKDISPQYPNHEGITVQIVSNGKDVEVWQTTEYVGSILLSEPLILDISKYENGGHVEDLRASFDGEKFIIHGNALNSTLN
jgi:hypothetical protein